MAAAESSEKERILLDVMVTTVQKNALMSILQALEIDVTEHVFTGEEEDVALIAAMKEGLKEGLATENDKKDFEAFLSEH